jgi:hypothetical protein
LSCAAFAAFEVFSDADFAAFEAFSDADFAALDARLVAALPLPLEFLREARLELARDELALRLREELPLPLPLREELPACRPLLLERFAAPDGLFAALDPFDPLEDARVRLLARLDDPRELVAAMSHLLD